MLVTKQTGGKARSSSRTFPPAAPAAACLLLCAGALAEFARPAVAQTWDARGFLTINGGQQAASPDFSDNIAFTDFAEEGDFDARYATGSDTVFDAGGGIRVWRNLGIGAGVSLFSHTGDAGITARIPHPFFFDRHRAVDGTEPGFAREETAVYLQALWVIPASRSFHIVGVVVVAILVYAQPATAQTPRWRVSRRSSTRRRASTSTARRTHLRFPRNLPATRTRRSPRAASISTTTAETSGWSPGPCGARTSRGGKRLLTVISRRCGHPYRWLPALPRCTAYLAFANNFGRTTPQSAEVTLTTWKRLAGHRVPHQTGLSCAETTSDRSLSRRCGHPYRCASGNTCTAYLALCEQLWQDQAPERGSALDVKRRSDASAHKTVRQLSDGRGGPSRPRFDHIRSARATAPAAS